MNFTPAPDWFHETVRSFLKTKFKCSECKVPLCSCSGAHRAEVVFLPGEREWIERQTEARGRKFRGDDPNKFEVCGDCFFLENYQCSLPNIKPLDCYSFPFAPQLVDGRLVPAFAANCSFSPDKLEARWIKEIWDAWQFVEQHVDPRWLEYYCQVPNYEDKLI